MRPLGPIRAAKAPAARGLAPQPLLRWSWSLALAALAWPWSAAALGTHVARADESLDERRQRVEQLSPDDLEELQRKREAFANLSPDRQRNLRTFHQDLEADPRAAELRETLQRYSAWLRTLPAGRRAELLGLPADERMSQIKQLLEQQRREQEQRVARSGGKVLSPDDGKVFIAWAEQWVGEHEEELLNMVPPGFFRDRLKQTEDPARRRMSLLFVLTRYRAEGSAPPQIPTDEDFEKLAEKLSEGPRAELKALPGRKERLDLVSEWGRGIFMNQFQPLAPSREELEKFFREEVNPNDRAWLEGLPPERFARELRRLFQAHSMRRNWEAGRGPGGGFPGGPGLPGGPGGPGGPAGGPPFGKPGERGGPREKRDPSDRDGDRGFSDRDPADRKGGPRERFRELRESSPDRPPAERPAAEPKTSEPPKASAAPKPSEES